MMKPYTSLAIFIFFSCAAFALGQAPIDDDDFVFEGSGRMLLPTTTTTTTTTTSTTTAPAAPELDGSGSGDGIGGDDEDYYDYSDADYEDYEVGPRKGSHDGSLGGSHDDGADVCTLPPETGDCRAMLHMVYYDAKDAKCKEFIFGGCGGNDNKFRTFQECEDKCAFKHDLSPQLPETPLKPEVHELPPATEAPVLRNEFQNVFGAKQEPEAQTPLPPLDEYEPAEESDISIAPDVAVGRDGEDRFTDSSASGPAAGQDGLGAKPIDRSIPFFARPGILAAVVGGAVVGLLCAILLVMLIVYRMRKKDEGSYPVDEPAKQSLTGTGGYQKNYNKEFYA